MKSVTKKIGRGLLAAAAIGTTLTLASWGYKQSPTLIQQAQFSADTVPQKNNRDRKVRDLDEAIAELDRVDMQVEMDKAMKEVAKALKEIDGVKIKQEIDKAMKEVDFDKIKAEVDKAMKEVEMDIIKAEVDASLAKIDWNEIKKEIDKVKQTDFISLEKELTQVTEELKKIQPTLEKELAGAKVEIEKAKETLKEYKTFVDGLDKDGLIDKDKEYTIEHKKGKLYINGKEADAKVYDKYRSFLEKHASLNIKKTADDFDVDID